MTYMHPEHDAIMKRVQEAGRQARRDSLRRWAAKYERGDGRYLVRWMFAGRADVISRAVNNQNDPKATKELCKSLYDDYTTALRLPQFLKSRQMRIDVLRELFASECALYLRQTKGANS